MSREERNGILRRGVFFSLLFFFWSACRPEPQDLEFRNWAKEVHYVGSKACQPCHAEIYEAFVQTEMGQSMVDATRDNSSAFFGPEVLVYDSIKNFYYHPFWKDSSLYVREFRLEAGDTVHLLEARIRYVVGSGQHTNSHLIERNGYLYQAPITFYTQEGRWDLAPGFAHGGNQRFFRRLEWECVSCHSDLPKVDTAAFHRYRRALRPIGCERCHGPGSLHVEEKMSGVLVDTALEADLSIVRPSRLTRERLMDLCQRCHLQGVSVLAEGKTYLDFRPGMRLHDYIRYFLPRYEDSDRAFIMASQADRLKQSACYQKSELSCLSCHDPHHSIRKTERGDFVRACTNCHAEHSDRTCSLGPAERKASGKDCISCHMPRSGSIDIPHVQITDHYIRKDSIWRKPAKGKAFLGLELLTGEPTPLLTAQGYLAFHERYDQGPEMLDSAFVYLQQSKALAFKEWVYYYFARGDYEALLSFVGEHPDHERDAYTAYRIGEAFLREGKAERALTFFEEALAKRPNHPPFHEKRGVALTALGRYAQAEDAFATALSLDSWLPVSLNNLAYLRALRGDYKKAESLYRQALRLDPDYARAWLNLGALLLQEGRKEESRRALLRCLALDPEMREAAVALEKFW